MPVPAHHVISLPPPFDAPPYSADIFSGRTVLVTGGGSGMGLAMARAFAQGGAQVAVMGRSLEKAQAGAARIDELGVRAHALSCDVRHPDQVAAAFDEVERELGPVSLLANNAGANFPVLAEDISVNAWNAVTRIAIDGTFLCSSEFARRRISRGEGGAIVNNSAQYIWTGFPGDAHSAAAKTAQATMTKKMARDWAPFGIRVNAIAAGFFPHETSTAGRREGGTEPLQNMIPAGRTGSIHEFGWLSALTCTPLLEGLTGQVILQDGGESLRRSLMMPDFVPPRERADGPWGWR
ncbi:NAD(P)-dependent dehydrogenase (short-subunit alcohol dehydrogenase family) [Novosphingobium kunmingense]|uniref:NAD(P)-dependent dehydrogenase (Short-subunit alcohol dehydrogenase family) n=1 Tax=Novosphingobium kunmingense TaxID=1211806 RepID=A0A2N0H616_9SPHN|nr:SDR family NAD(P)-dependent oxidoreductase [Novosphingobium kunmingense]PKB14378.1 NAD(P)-dependent dehydrogenase (short-subunit alcohol dehydrogenase family) [Novosphingobium kunmingense]